MSLCKKGNVLLANFVTLGVVAQKVKNFVKIAKSSFILYCKQALSNPAQLTNKAFK